MNYLAIDLWDKRCGLAYSQMNFAFPLPFVNRVELIQKLKKIIPERNINIIVVWVPYDLYGKQEKQKNKTLDFISKLKNIFPNISIKEMDERFTTIESISILKNIWSKDIDQEKDSMSACLILESYLDKIKTP